MPANTLVVGFTGDDSCRLACCCRRLLAQSGSYTQTNIVSDGSVAAQKTDPTLINPWGVSIGPAFWIDTAGTGFSLVDDASGNKQFSVTIPPAVLTEKNGSPAGTVFNADATVFNIPGSGSAQFLFGNLDGSIAAWNQSTPQPVTVVNNSAAKAVYTDIAVVKNNTGTFLLAANFAGKKVDVFDSTFKPAKLAGSFNDPGLPSGIRSVWYSRHRQEHLCDICAGDTQWLGEGGRRPWRGGSVR